MLAIFTPTRSALCTIGLGLIVGLTAMPAVAAPREPKSETITVSARALKDDASKLCMPRKDADTRKTVTMCLTRDGWAEQGVTIIVK